MKITIEKTENGFIARRQGKMYSFESIGGLTEWLKEQFSK